MFNLGASFRIATRFLNCVAQLKMYPTNQCLHNLISRIYVRIFKLFQCAHIECISKFLEIEWQF